MRVSHIRRDDAAVAIEAHNLKVGSSNLPPATNFKLLPVNNFFNFIDKPKKIGCIIVPN